MLHMHVSAGANIIVKLERCFILGHQHNLNRRTQSEESTIVSSLRS